VTGIGGTGVLTVGALMGMAAHLEDKHCRILDQTGLAQKGGEVLSHVRLAGDSDEMRTGHIITGGADLLLACDIVAAVGKTAHETLNPERTKAVVNTNNTPVAEFVLHNNVDFHDTQMKQALNDSTIETDRHYVPATSYAMTLLGDEIATNVFILGYAWQKGLIPLHRESLERAIELNGVAIEANKKAFSFGRLAAYDPAKIEEMAAEVRGDKESETVAVTLEDIIAKRAAYLADYQNESYAKRYTDMVARVQEKEKAIAGDSTILSEAVARSYHKLLAYKDEYEVARLYTNGAFLKELKSTFQGDYKIRFNMAPPIMEKQDPATGRPQKREFGSWMLGALGVLAKFKFLRGTPLDLFGYHKDRKAERDLIRQYEQDMEAVLQHLEKKNMALCAEILSLPDEIRGYGPVKEGNIKRAGMKRDLLLKRLADPVEGDTARKAA